jgi:SAM-dependent methyltransferase
MSSDTSDWRGDEWEKWGRTDPYFGVITDPSFRSAKLDEAGRLRFFQSGEAEVAETLAVVRQLTGPQFRLKRTLDFGCGVGRLTIPLARQSEAVVAVDVSPAMLDEARANCVQAGLTNVEFRRSQPGLPDVDGPFDLVHSYIVFQHIPPKVGYGLFEDILDRVGPNGVGMLHFTYDRRSPLLKRIAHGARRSSRVAHRLLNLVQRRPPSAPLMGMFEYDATRLLNTLQRRGFDHLNLRLTNHAGCHGFMLGFSRSSP